jgi:hypothetical protein
MAATMRPQDLAADRTIRTNTANQQEAGFPVRVGAGTELDDVAGRDRVVVGRGGGMAGAFEQGLQEVYFIGGEHARKSIDTPG